MEFEIYKTAKASLASDGLGSGAIKFPSGINPEEGTDAESIGSGLAAMASIIGAEAATAWEEGTGAVFIDKTMRYTQGEG